MNAAMGEISLANAFFKIFARDGGNFHEAIVSAAGGKLSFTVAEKAPIAGGGEEIIWESPSCDSWGCPSNDSSPSCGKDWVLASAARQRASLSAGGNDLHARFGAEKKESFDDRDSDEKLFDFLSGYPLPD
jgi:hypothetical protein